MLRRFIILLGVVSSLLSPFVAAKADIVVTSSYSGNTIGVYDPGTGAVANPALAKLSVSGVNAGVAVDLASSRVFISNINSSAVYVLDFNTGSVISNNFLAGVSRPDELLLDGSGKIYVSNFNSGSVGVYDATTGAAIKTQLVSGVSEPSGLAVDKAGYLYVASYGSGTIGKYIASTGQAVNANYISGIGGAPNGMTLDQFGNIYVTRNLASSVAKFDSSGKLINSTFIANLGAPTDITIDSQGHLFVASAAGIGEYDSSTGAAINASFVTTGSPNWIVAAVPEPSSVALVALSALLGISAEVRRRFLVQRQGTCPAPLGE